MTTDKKHVLLSEILGFNYFLTCNLFYFILLFSSQQTSSSSNFYLTVRNFQIALHKNTDVVKHFE